MTGVWAHYYITVKHVSHDTTKTHPPTLSLSLVYIFCIYRVWWLNCHLNYAKIKITLTPHLIRIYLLKLDENIFKYYRLTLKKSLVTSTSNSWQLQNLLQAFSNGLLVWIAKCCHYSCLQIIFGVKQFCWSLTQLYPMHNNQGDCNLGS